MAQLRYDDFSLKRGYKEGEVLHKYCAHCGTKLVLLDHTQHERYIFSTCIMCGRYSDHKCDQRCKDFISGKISKYNTDDIPIDRRRKVVNF